MPVTGFSLDVSLAALPLRVVEAGQEGRPAYREERIAGADVPGQAATVHFSDEFTSWHKGGFVTEDVQDGYYGTSENVDCSYPGRIFPSFRRRTNIDIAPRTDGGDLPFGPIAGIAGWPWHTNTPAVLTFYHRATDAGTGTTDAITIIELREDGTEGASLTTALTLNAYHFNYIEPVWFLDRWFVPMDDKGYASYDPNWVLHGNVPVWNFGVAPDRLYRLHVSGGYLYISNMDVSDDPTALASWTDPGLRLPYVGSTTFELARVYTMGRFPYVATKAGVFSVGKGGFAEALFPQFLSAPSRCYDFKAFRYYNAMLATSTTSGQILLLNGEKATAIGPLVNPLAKFPGGNAPQILDIFSTSTGVMFATIWDGTNRAIWKGVPRTPGETGPGPLAWHQIIGIQGDPPIGGNLSMTRPLAILNFVGTPYDSPDTTWLWYGQGNGRIFRWNIGDWGDMEGGGFLHEDGASRQADSGTANAAVTTTNTTLTDTREALHWAVNEWLGFIVTCNGKTMTVVSNTSTALTGTAWSDGGNPGDGHAWTLDETTMMAWESGRYDRGHKKAIKHWTALGFVTENLASDQTITVEYRVDGGTLVSAGTLITSPYQQLPIDALGYDIEIRLVFNPKLTTGITSPPTVRRIVYEGREVPQELTLISMTCEGDPAPQSGGVRLKDWADDMLAAINVLSDSLKQTFRDPFKVDRTVVVLPATETDIQRAQGSQVPQSTINIRLLVVP